MAIALESSETALVELDFGSSPESLGRLLDAQRELFHSQIDELQKVVVAQCRLTGVNPLSQEMAAGALSIKIGKRPRDLLNPKAMKYLKSVFSIKDTIGKKETREISALCGITVSQVREFITGQRSRVRKFVRLSHERAVKLEAPRASNDGCSPTFEFSFPVSGEKPMNIASTCMGNVHKEVHGNSGNLSAFGNSQQVPVNPSEVKTGEEGPSCSLQVESIPGIDLEDKKFLENILNLMRKEETFSGQVKLMQWVLQIKNPVALNWFLAKGAMTLLATWLSQATVEEQTTIIVVLFKVLLHLPLNKASPEEMSDILQAVNRLRFYRAPEISNKAKVLLSRWSKMFIRNQSLKKPLTNFLLGTKKDMIRKQRISEILSDGSWQSKIDIPEEILALTDHAENIRESEPNLVLKLLPASGDDLNKKLNSSNKTKQRRQVLLVEQPDGKSTGRSAQVARVVSSNHSRPMSADDIQKAKMRSMFMRNKYGKTDTLISDINPQKAEEHKASTSESSIEMPSCRSPLRPQVEMMLEDTKPLVSTSENTYPPSEMETPTNSKPKTQSKEQLQEELKKNQFPWRTPPEIRIDSSWSVGAGENSKEVEFQTGRNGREKETFYADQQDIPPNPKEPWDTEMDFDDSLTPEIPTEQSPDADSTEGMPTRSPESRVTAGDMSASSSAASQSMTNGTLEPDMELLAVLLKNPELVFALTSGQGTNLSGDQTVALLEMVKRSGLGPQGAVNGEAGSSRMEPEPTSLPSPTPPSEQRSGWRSEHLPFSNNPPPLQHHFTDNRVAATISPPIASPTIAPTKVPLTVMSQTSAHGPATETPATIFSMPHLTVTVNHTPQSLTHSKHMQRQPPAPLFAQNPVNLHAVQQRRASPDSNLPTSHYSITRPAIPAGQAYNRNPPLSTVPPLPATLVPGPMRPQSPFLGDRPMPPARTPAWSASAPVVARSMSSLEVQPVDTRLAAHQSNHGYYPSVPSQQRHAMPGPSTVRDETTGRSRYETWSPEDGYPAARASSEYRYGQGFPGSRREQGRDLRQEWSGQWDSGHRDPNNRPGPGSGSSRRRPDHDRRR